MGECGKRRTAWALVALCVCACSREQAPAPAPAAAASPAVITAAPQVSIGGEESAETVARWQPPPVDLGEQTVVQARQRADQALQEDRLYRQPDDAIPLYLAIQRRTGGKDAASRRGLERARARLLELGHEALARIAQQDTALEQARELAIVALALAPDDPKVRDLQQRVETAQRVLAFNRAGEDDLRAGRLGEDGNGALINFRDAAQLDPEDPRARQGLAAVESALLRRAERAADAGNFVAARYWVQMAAKARHQAPTIADARARIERVRRGQIAALRDAGLRDLTSPRGLKAAGEKLASVLRIADPGDPMVGELRRRLELATHYGSFRPGQVFTDGLKSGGRGPQMIVVPHGAFRMGAADSERGASDNERPAHYVRFARGFALSITEVTVAEFRQFVEATGARPRATRRGHSVVYDERSGNFIRRSGVDWQSDYNGARAAPNSPVMHVSIRDAEAYAAWLSEQTGRHYHLPSEAEFEYALRAGTSGRYPWGNAGTPPIDAGNYTGGNDVSRSGRHWNNGFVGYGDGFWGPAPVGSFRANPWGLHDMGGNLSEWVADCWHASYRRAPADGAAWFNPGCRQRVVRGGSWANSPQQTRAAWRLSQDSDTTSARIGFRVARGI
ncbi:SUMF1/EgtB/PvdO family nonheme iron enzyme [Xanthomonas maliensis]|uniref:SUMF1/EgtB/PvdO family nonheme iron enzyme n=1 Tax=Xanthomonas maliensis TaxID=1321368 RepID=UPI00068E8635|nr:SUMF1/EgtB/PvdO family nonheme iron enzyme [Xanthomonas maliensis]KAB7764921.1 serine/threonine kinase [Xanthomonas maliensis]